VAVIALNPGHYPGLDPGSVGPTGLEEATVSMVVAKITEAALQGNGHSVVFISENDLDNIADDANLVEADVFVSVHCNSAESAEAQGTETWCYEYSEQGYRLAQEIQRELVDALQRRNRGIRYSSGLYVLKNTFMPAALAELAFISNSEEEQLLADPLFQEQAGLAIARGIEAWLNDI
jgi:N-acetylmuramoyl-L-alanine amidase